ncbi:helix-turn-helix domain-containing protein [Coxiella endosymbiont of Amblyomma nuttalli]|uniref:helix-turn-helix domain-containing protein n=1 Tax=Coxiella endosymbiont of Amblyomma nuttalli TaxID=2749996 RepID=UPI001BAB4AB0|nr:helix-turn-helix domain-containing protein [Coxiella endosymbiont of Amblyomma nuttalli]QTS83840.1 Cytoskeleton protein RodZ [Coxiella endosymbiont of Amblyomma nuttalli]
MTEANFVDMETKIDSRLANGIKTPGVLLQDARKAKKLSQIEIAKQIHLSLQRVKELEKDNYSNMSALIYVRGYLRAYARCVGISPNEVIAAFDASALEEEFERVKKAQEEKPVRHQTIPVIARSTRIISSKVVCLIVMAILLSLAIFVSIWWKGKKHIISQMHVVVSQPEESLPLNSTVSSTLPEERFVPNNDFSGTHH